MAVSTELENIKDTDIKLEKLFKSKGTPKVNTNKKVNQKGNNNHPPKENNINKYAWNKVPPKQCEKDTKTTHNKTYNRCKWNKSWVEHEP